MLYLVSTPIGNLQDISLRALETLKKADIVLAEDTRRTALLLNHYSISKKMVSYNDKNNKRVTPGVISLLKEDKEIVLVSDNETPSISDPGFYLVRAAVSEGIKLTHIPGPSAFVSALVCSGLPTDKFTFHGFLPKKDKAKKDLFNSILDGTNIFYESPHRISKTLEMLSDIMPEADITISREMTKKFEEFIRGRAREVYLNNKDRVIKGEIVLIINKAE